MLFIPQPAQRPTKELPFVELTESGYTRPRIEHSLNSIFQLTELAIFGLESGTTLELL
jgi:hypothetical protein